MATINPNEPATVIFCNKCGGFIMCCIDQYMDDEYLALIESATGEGKIIKKTKAKALSKVFEDCFCTPKKVPSDADVQQVTTKAPQPVDQNRPKKPTLSLRNRAEN